MGRYHVFIPCDHTVHCAPYVHLLYNLTYDNERQKHVLNNFGILVLTTREIVLYSFCNFNQDGDET